MFAKSTIKHASDKKCNAIMIDQAELDTVPICRDRRMTMEAIMTRDQRTTSHRVLERGGQSNGNITTSYQKIMKTSNNKTRVKESSTSIGKNDVTRTAMTCRRNVHDVVDLTKTRKHKTENEEESLRCDETCHCRCNFENDTRQIERDFTNECRKRNNFIGVDRRLSHLQHRTNVITWLRLGSLLVTLLMVTVQGAPTAMTLEDRRLSSPPKWVNPCGLAAEDFDGDLDVVQLKDEQLLGQVVVQAKTALDHAQLFRDDYIKRTFNTDFTDLHTTWKGNHYDWLPGLKEIPKQLGEHLDQEYLDKLEVRLLDNALLDAYEYMQRYAVGLEQIVWDQEDHRLEFRKQFKETEFKLRTVLCELQVALVERGVAPRPDVTRDAMSGEYRAMSASATFRNLRDWLIFRDYMNGLEYVVQVFEHLRRGLES